MHKLQCDAQVTHPDSKISTDYQQIHLQRKPKEVYKKSVSTTRAVVILRVKEKGSLDVSFHLSGLVVTSQLMWLIYFFAYRLQSRGATEDKTSQSRHETILRQDEARR